MVITEEIIAAYIEGKVSEDERKEVRRYLAIHPEMQDLVLALMDDSEDIEEDNAKPNAKSVPLHSEQCYSDIAFAAAAFAPKMIVESSVDKENVENQIGKRRKRMASFWNELEKGD